MTRDRYLGVNDPRDPAPGDTPGPEPFPASGRGAPAEAPPDSETDRCVRAMRDVLLGQPVPRSLEEAAVEIERRMREGNAGATA